MDADYRELLERIPAGVIIVRDGTIQYVNRTTVEWFGLADAGEAVGQSALRFVHPDDHEAALARLRELSGAPATDPTREYRGMRADGGTIYLEMASVPIEIEGAPAILLVARDVTEKRRARAQLVSADRMATLGMLSAGIAHEINSPLTHVVLGLSSIAKHLERNPEGLSREGIARLVDQVRTARDGAARVVAIARDLRAFTGSDDEERVPVDVHSVLDSAVNLARVEIDRRARLVRDYGQLEPVRGNHAKLAQVFLNLLDNAARSFREPEDLKHNLVTLRTRQDAAREVTVDVCDTGEGISDAEITRIFEPFYTTRPVGVGAGVGLWICKSIVTELDGHIVVDSAPGRGTTVSVSLPVAADAS